MRNAWLLAATTGLALSCWQQSGLAMNDGTRAAARNLVNEAANDFKVGHFELARAKFMQALAVAQLPTVAVWAARAHEKLGKLVAAVDLYERALLMQPNDWWVGSIQHNAQVQARQTLSALKPRVPTIKISLTGASPHEVQVTIDETAIPTELLSDELPLDPGRHRVVALRNGYKIEREITLAEGVKDTVTLVWPQLPRPAASTAALPVTSRGSPSPSRIRAPEPETSNHPRLDDRRHDPGVQQTAAWVALGLGATGILVGVTAGTIAGLQRSSLHADGCVANACPDTFAHRVNDYNMWRTISTVGFVAGGVALATGLTLVFTKEHRESAVSLRVSILPDTVNFAGVFRGL